MTLNNDIISGFRVPLDKAVRVSLTYVYGIGVSSANDICSKFSIDRNTKFKDLSQDLLLKLRSYIDSNYIIGGDQKKIKMMSIDNEKKIKTFRGLRHHRGLPVRGQNTHSNAATRKKRRVV